MASSTIPNSAGPGSAIELSEVTIAVRDKVIEKFANESLEKMNESLKMLLNHEQDEQKRLGILAARVYILRQRIVKLSEGDGKRVVTSAAPKPEADTAKTDSQNTEGENASEWTRLRILEDCEVNGVRFPKTVIIDVKGEDAAKLIESGNAEPIKEKPAEAATDTDASDATGDAAIANSSIADEGADADAGDGIDIPSVQTDSAEAAPAAPITDEAETAVEDVADDAEGSEDDLSDLAAALAEPEAQDDADNNDYNAENDGENVETTNEAFIEAPSAAEVTAALEALGAGDTMDVTAAPPSDAGKPTATAAEDAAVNSVESKGDDDASGSWFEAQQNAEAASKSELDAPADGSASDENEDETESDK